MAVPGQSTNVDVETPLLTEVRMLREGIRDIKQQNWNLEAKVSTLSENVSRKFDRMETRLSARTDETVVLKQALFEHKTKMINAFESIKTFFYIFLLLVLLYGYFEVVSKQRFDWSKLLSQYYNLYRSFT